MIKYFLRVVEIQTKLASVLPFLFTYFIIILNGYEINYLYLLLFFIAMLTFDMSVTLINTIYGINNEEVDTSDNKELSRILNSDLKKINYKFLLILLSISILIGFYLILNSTIIFLLISGMCFVIGITYSYGPIKTCQTPFGEILSGIAMGILLPFLIVESQTNFISNNLFNINLMKPILIFLPLAFLIAAIMLANNIVDVEEDIQNKRYTIVYYLGKKRAIFCYKLLYLGVLGIIILNIILGLVPFLFIMILPFVIKAVQVNVNSIKKIMPVKNFLKITSILIIMNIITILIKHI